MSTLLPLVRITASHLMSPQRLERVPEDEAVSDGAEQVMEYDRVLETPLALTYAAIESLVFRCLGQVGRGQALDIACGPGHLSLSLLKHGLVEGLTGVDLSPGMVDVAQGNAELLGQAGRASFSVDDATTLGTLPSQHFDLVLMTNAAHHFEGLCNVTEAFDQMLRVVRPDGVIVLTDVVRFSNRDATEQYVRFVGRDLRLQGLAHFHRDFEQSMFAAWTADELRSAIPASASHRFFHMVPPGLPTMQFIIGVPKERSVPFVRASDTRVEEQLVPAAYRMEWAFARVGLKAASPKEVVVMPPLPSTLGPACDMPEPRTEGRFTEAFRRGPLGWVGLSAATPWAIDRWGRFLVSVGLLSMVAAAWVIHPAFLLVVLATALNLFITSLTDKCALRNFLQRLGAQEREELFLPGGQARATNPEAPAGMARKNKRSPLGIRLIQPPPPPAEGEGSEAPFSPSTEKGPVEARSRQVRLS